MFFSSIKEINRLRKQINRLLSKGMSNIYLKSYCWEKVTYSKLFDFKKFVKKVPLQVRFWGAPTHADIIEFWNVSLQLKNQSSGDKTARLLSYFYFERNYDVLKSRSPCFLLNKSESKTENFRVINLVLQLSSYKNCQIKVKPWVGDCEKKRESISSNIYFVRRKLF